MAKLYVIPGHGAGDPGAGGNGYNEAERVRALATKIKQYGGDDVTLHDFNDNAYASGAINYLNLPAGTQIVELHMDSASGARGAHVIYKAGYTPDEYDVALADFISNVFPGRANKLVGRSDLANVNRAANRGFGYRLVENGFISSAEDVAIFNSRMDEIAKGYCRVFGIGVQESTPAPEPSTPTTPSRPTTGAANVPADPTPAELEELATKVQDGRFGNGEARKQALGSIYQMVQDIVDARNGKNKPAPEPAPAPVAKIDVDGYWGKDTTTALQKYYGTTVDGIVSHQWPGNVVANPGLTTGWEADYTQNGSQVIKALQKDLGVEADGLLGPNTIKALQRRLGTVIDGRLDAPSTCVKVLQTKLNQGKI